MLDGASDGAGRMLGYAASILAALILVSMALTAPAVVDGRPVLFALGWAPSLSISLAFMVDGLSLIFGLLISGIGSLIILYATGYMGEHPHFARFVLFLFAFMVSMLGLVLARDLITLFLFWELTSITSYLLIGFDHNNPRARRNALQAMLITAGGGLALLAGFILIGTAAGGYDLAQILAGPGLQDGNLYGAILVLVLLGAFTKSAQFPFHFWLPNAMAAPTPVSAYLHSATMVKAGVYLLARLHPALGGTLAWSVTLATAGAVTAVLASVLAMRQSDLKQVLAYTTLMALGTITMLLAGAHPYALTAAMTFLIVHSLYKASLFMVVGAIDHGTGTREVAQLGGLGRAMPLTALAAVLACASMAGLPPMIGWIGKELIYAGAETMTGAPFVAAVAVAANALMFAVAGIIALRPFFGAPITTPHQPHEAPWQMLAGPIILTLGGLVVGVLAQPLLGSVIGSALTGSLLQDRAAGLHLWAGFNRAFVLSLLTFTLGIMLYLMRARFAALVDPVVRRLPSLDDGWDRVLDGLRVLAAWQTRMLQTGRLTAYLMAVFAVVALALGLTIIRGRPEIAVELPRSAFLWLTAIFTAAGAVLALNTHSRIAAIAGIGTVGIGVAVIFIYAGAPDVATTQLMVETLSAVMFAIAALRLPGITERRSPRRQMAHGVVAVTTGLCVTAIILSVTASPLDRSITSYFEENSYALAHGLNIVNVVLVDFRAFDTFGELIVVLLASFGAYAVLKRKRKAGP
ncbi:hydrogen gas-evolving membrane-bound hydrogenase subunit E [Paracoccus benzoatiresistens]|uniref:Proton-conducting transporter membrane subunit n=1 Tax=Paracoccus benzoatiresistens TaxID=2997341 RepID=A0ABT4J917_9RHOB|nr:hydrogen gas-evolving membrane-bound hydrogenase subunit E [Paracoccus sp. EF6]MCZ0963414.1 proton-conducting transporter membrane subunit [Paracoccus sp. EF6]